MMHSEPLHKKKPDRQARLRAWLILHGIEQKEIAGRLGVGTGMVSMILGGQRITPERVEQLVAMGIPRRLLPDPEARRAEKGNQAA